MLALFGYISALLSILMIVPYARDILLLKTKPERASWFIWTVLGFIAFFIQLAKGATDSLWLTAGQTFAVFIIVLLSIKYGAGGLGKRDRLALIAAGVGLLLWYFTSEPLYALLIVIVIDSIGSLLTALKSYEDPGSETLSTWIMSGASGVFGCLAVGSLSPVLLAYPFYIVITNSSIAVCIFIGRTRMRKVRK